MVALEKAGLPTVSIVARGFEADFQTSARIFGLPQLPYVVIPYTMTSRSRDEAAIDLDGVFEDLATTLVSQPREPAPKKKAQVLPAELERFEADDLLKGWHKFNHDFTEIAERVP